MSIAAGTRCEQLNPTDFDQESCTFTIPSSESIMTGEFYLTNLGGFCSDASLSYFPPTLGVGHVIDRCRYEVQGEAVWTNDYAREWQYLQNFLSSNAEQEDINRVERYLGTGYRINTVTDSESAGKVNSFGLDSFSDYFAQPAELFGVPPLATTLNRNASQNNQSGMIPLSNLAPYYKQMGRSLNGLGVDPPAPDRRLTLIWNTDPSLAVFAEPAPTQPTVQVLRPQLWYRRYPDEFSAAAQRLAFSSVYEQPVTAEIFLPAITEAGTQTVDIPLTTWNNRKLNTLIFFNSPTIDKFPLVARTYAQALLNQVIQVYGDNGLILTHENGINSASQALMRLHQDYGVMNFPYATAQPNLTDASQNLFDPNTSVMFSTAGITALKMGLVPRQQIRISISRDFSTGPDAAWENQAVRVIVFGLCDQRFGLDGNGNPVLSTTL